MTAPGRRPSCDRKTGLAVAVVIILALIAALVLKIRELDRRRAVTDHS